MQKLLFVSFAAATLSSAVLCAQDAEIGFAAPTTLTLASAYTHRADVESPGGAATPAFRAVFYPTLKLGSHWFAYGAVQVHSTGFFFEELSSRKREVQISLLQAYVGYSTVKNGRSLTIKAGKLSSAFGSFPLRYDDSRNWLIDLPQSYGYYYFPVSVNGLPGAEVDAVVGRFDARVQLTNSSPSNPRRLNQSDQYANWTGGAGYTIRQGFRVGVSVYRGPYLDRAHQFFLPGESPPVGLPATGYGTDVQWGHGRWNLNGEAQRFRFAYHAMPDYYSTNTYGEARFSVNPRTYLAGRVSGRWQSYSKDQAFEFAIGFRPGESQLIKAGYQALWGADHPGTRDNVMAVQYVISLNPPALTHN